MDVSHISGINTDVAWHKLDINPKAKLILQVPRRMAIDRQEKDNEEVAKLLSVGFIKPVEYPK